MPSWTSSAGTRRSGTSRRRLRRGCSTRGTGWERRRAALAPGGTIDLAVAGTGVVPTVGCRLRAAQRLDGARPTARMADLASGPRPRPRRTRHRCNFSTRHVHLGPRRRQGRHRRTREHPHVGRDRRRRRMSSGGIRRRADYARSTPARLLDTRTGPGRAERPRSMPAGVGASGRSGGAACPSTGVRAVVLTVMVTGAGHERLPHGVPHPAPLGPTHVERQLSRAGQTIVNTARRARPSSDGYVRRLQSAARPTLVVDVQGYLARVREPRLRRGDAQPTGSVTKSMSSSTLARRVGSRSA